MPVIYSARILQGATPGAARLVLVHGNEVSTFNIRHANPEVENIARSKLRQLLDDIGDPTLSRLQDFIGKTVDKMPK